jgi:hypothetical protein
MILGAPGVASITPPFEVPGSVGILTSAWNRRGCLSSEPLPLVAFFFLVLDGCTNSGRVVLPEKRCGDSVPSVRLGV